MTNSLPERPTAPKRKRQPKEVSTVEWQKNYINEYSKLFANHETLRQENDDLKQLINEQKMTIKKLKESVDILSTAPSFEPTIRDKSGIDSLTTSDSADDHRRSHIS